MERNLRAKLKWDGHVPPNTLSPHPCEAARVVGAQSQLMHMQQRIYVSRTGIIITSGGIIVIPKQLGAVSWISSNGLAHSPAAELSQLRSGAAHVRSRSSYTAAPVIGPSPV